MNKIAKDTLTNAGLLLMLGGLIYASWDLLWPSAHADNDHHHSLTPPTQTYVSRETIIYQVDSQAIAFSQAGANNHISSVTFNPQLSFAIGAYERDMAASLMFGQKACKDCLLFSGSFAFDGDFEEKSVGFGMTLEFK